MTEKAMHDSGLPRPEYTDEMLDAVLTSLLSFDEAGRILRSNSLAREDLRLPAEQLHGKRVEEVFQIVHRDRDLLPEMVEALLGGEKRVVLPSEAVIQSRDRRARFFAQGAFTRLENGHILLAFRNVVESLTQEHMLQMSLSSTKIFPWFYDMERNTMIIDKRYFEYTGIPTVDNTMSLETFSERLHPDDREKMTYAFEKQLGGLQYPYPVPFRLLMGDGTYEWFEGQSTYLGQVDGVPYRIVGICMSTQAHKDIEQKLIDARDKAEESDRLKSAFLANMSHEIRTPLNAIVGFSNVLSSGEIEAASDEGRQYAMLIETNCQQLLHLITDVFDLSSIESGSVGLTPAPVSLAALLTDLAAQAAPQIHLEGSAGITLDLPADDLRPVTDRDMLAKALGNLLSNAAKFTSRGEIRLGFRPAADGVDIFVADTGSGIEASELEHIFDRFYKADIFTQGAGLGLSISRLIAERLGGTLTAASERGAGSCFTLHLPLDNDADNASAKSGKS